jgi:acyl-CoA synthetase (AMP-forming)/AMP-acid ligase II
MRLLAPRWVMAESALYALASLAPARWLLERRGVSLPNLTAVAGARLVLGGRRLPWTPRALTYRGLRRLPGGEAAPALDPADPAFVVFTSGTTAAPRGVVHSGATIGATLGLLGAALALEPDDVLYTDQLHLAVPALMAGATAVVPRSPFSPARARADLARFQATHAFFVPAQLGDLLLGSGPALPDSLRAVLLGSAPAPASLLARCRERLPPGVRVVVAYAMTEMLPVSWVRLEEKLAFTGDGDLVGRPARGVEARIAPDGELLLRGANLCDRLLGGEPLREVATGDLARVDAEGRLVLLGRKKDMIIRGERNLYPALIEERVTAIEGVRRCALVGLPDPVTADEEVVLAVEPLPGTDGDRLLARLRRELESGPRRLDTTARPDRIVLTEIPLGGRSSKVDRAALRERLRRC